jgi:hypothetical protein
VNRTVEEWLLEAKKVGGEVEDVGGLELEEREGGCRVQARAMAREALCKGRKQGRGVERRPGAKGGEVWNRR